MNKVAFIGAGNMSKAIIIGLINQGFKPENIMVSNPSPQKREALAEQFGILHTEDNLKAAAFSDNIVLAVKPHLIKDVCQHISAGVDVSQKSFISVAASISIEQIQYALGQKVPVVRCMPNTPSQLGLGMTGLFASDEVNEQQYKFADELLLAVGKVLWLKKESQIDDISTVSGSGPAYFFAFMEAMQQQAIDFGFSESDARMLVEQTALGAAQMVVDNDESISTLRQNVTSKGGTTQEALRTFRNGRLADMVSKAMKAAKARAIEICKNN